MRVINSNIFINIGLEKMSDTDIIRSIELLNKKELKNMIEVFTLYGEDDKLDRRKLIILILKIKNEMLIKNIIE